MVEKLDFGKEGDASEVHDVLGEYDVGRDFTSLDAWKHAREVKLFFYRKILVSLPSEEKYALDVQIRKAAISITANIAEGYGRYHYKEGIQYYRISRGSLYELKDHLISCNDLKYIDTDLFDEGVILIETAKKLLNGYIKFVRGQLSKKNENRK
jgi:four helix bundle protein